MRFPLRLTADLALHLAGQPLRGKSRQSSILRFAPMEEESRSPRGAEAIDGAQKSAAAISTGVGDSRAPVVWFAGPDALLHPQAALWARSVLDCGRHVFLQTEANLLRRRIHEFQPVPQFSFVVEFSATPESHDLRVGGRPSASASAAEAIRVAKLSGFFTCAHTTIGPDSVVDQLSQLAGYLQSLKVDGWVIVPAIQPHRHRANSSQELIEARQLIPSRRWRLFSELVEHSAVARHDFQPAPELSPEPPPTREVCNESVQAP
jgi:MoaA/NifB/PqqE/SkfB family radical SAM enzyme